MPRQFKLVLILATVSFTCSCEITKEPKIPELPKIPEIPTFNLPRGTEPPPTGSPASTLKDLFVCDKATENTSDEVKRNAIQVRGTTSYQDVESLDCDGKKTFFPKFPLNDFKANLTIPPPERLSPEVTFAIVENNRTCVSRRVMVSPGNTSRVTPGDPLWSAHPYWIDAQGLILLGLTDSSARAATGLNVLSGPNLLSITYFGRCLETPDEGGICTKAEELAKKQVLITVDLVKQELNGVRVFNSCDKTKNK
ncbi:MAG: hypothetical protein AB7G93_16530 [Bdellovibrionales bacterium]